MLAYSSIAHAGYLLVGVVALRASASRARSRRVLFYLLAYTFTTLGAFGVVAWIGNRKRRAPVRRRLGRASARRARRVALAMTIFLLSLGGVPPTGGFFGKFYLFKAAMETPAALLAGRRSACSTAWSASTTTCASSSRCTSAIRCARSRRPTAPRCAPGLLLTAIAVVLLGIFPSTFVDWAGPAR